MAARRIWANASSRQTAVHHSSHAMVGCYERRNCAATGGGLMVTDQEVGDELSSDEHQSHLLRAVIASTIGTTIEWYDFFLYSLASGLVFAKLYFPDQDPLTGTLNAFAIYAVGFASRPVGAAIFGHYGDRLGRKSTLIITLLLMGIATFLVALVPAYNSIGICGAIIPSLRSVGQVAGGRGRWA